MLATVERALARAIPEIGNSDQGSHFTSPQDRALLTTAGVQISMDGKGRALDNIFTERLWRTVKYQEGYLHDYASPGEARQSLTRISTFTTTSGCTRRSTTVRRPRCTFRKERPLP